MGSPGAAAAPRGRRLLWGQRCNGAAVTLARGSGDGRREGSGQLARPLRSQLQSWGQGCDSNTHPQPGRNRGRPRPLSFSTGSQQPGYGGRTACCPLSWDKWSWGSLDLHVTAEQPCPSVATLPGWLNVPWPRERCLPLTLYLPALCGCIRMPPTRPGPQTSLISGSSRLLGRQPGQILNKEAGREAGWVINAELELRYQAQQAILG